MASSSSWRELLKGLIAVPSERAAAAERIGLNPITFVRWVQGTSKPTMQNLIELPNAFPAHREEFIDLIEQEYGIHLRDSQPITPSVFSPEQAIPSEFLLKVLGEYARASGPFAAWYIRTQCLEQLLSLLDPGKEGMDISIIRCIPPRSEGVHVQSLCEVMGIGNPPWPSGVDRRLLFLGSESLAGWVVEHSEPSVIQDFGSPGLLPFRITTGEKSAAAYPILRAGKIGGCLMASSNIENAWTPLRLYCLDAYAKLLALPMGETDFYESQRIALREMTILAPSREQHLLLEFQDRLRQLRRAQHTLSIVQAETLVLQQMEAALMIESE
ncbi:hypothetical protein KSF_086750 [Reticulibacter mediterranei]|uniref:Uncharacterized protein n=1 Tax=Reticulibacter mediterranei TaxID=2778369 RepID=A0A8J3N8V2_9CHLR|nr:hypothetical protein [Reticulibacter mediterranei]GHO98627.1 hypothetical protein KSF_086750 [Reticulibacter mediterranei]